VLPFRKSQHLTRQHPSFTPKVACRSSRYSFSYGYPLRLDRNTRECPVAIIVRVIVYGFTNTADLSLPTRYLATYTSAYVGFAYCTTTEHGPDLSYHQHRGSSLRSPHPQEVRHARFSHPQESACVRLVLTRADATRAVHAPACYGPSSPATYSVCRLSRLDTLSHRSYRNTVRTLRFTPPLVTRGLVRHPRSRLLACYPHEHLRLWCTGSW
jgi:hypothetical protein